MIRRTNCKYFELLADIIYWKIIWYLKMSRCYLKLKMLPCKSLFMMSFWLLVNIWAKITSIFDRVKLKINKSWHYFYRLDNFEVWSQVFEVVFKHYLFLEQNMVSVGFYDALNVACHGKAGDKLWREYRVQIYFV